MVPHDSYLYPQLTALETLRNGLVFWAAPAPTATSFRCSRRSISPSAAGHPGGGLLGAEGVLSCGLRPIAA